MTESAMGAAPDELVDDGVTFAPATNLSSSIGADTRSKGAPGYKAPAGCHKPSVSGYRLGLAVSTPIKNPTTKSAAPGPDVGGVHIGIILRLIRTALKQHDQTRTQTGVPMQMPVKKLRKA